MNTGFLKRSCIFEKNIFNEIISYTFCESIILYIAGPA